MHEPMESCEEYDGPVRKEFGDGIGGALTWAAYHDGWEADRFFEREKCCTAPQEGGFYA